MPAYSRHPNRRPSSGTLAAAPRAEMAAGVKRASLDLIVGDWALKPEPSTLPQENQRRDTRVESRIPVVLLRGKTEIPLFTSDVSFRGLFVCTEDPPALRSLVRLRVLLPTHAFETHAMVVRVAADGDRTIGAGLQFWGLAGADRVSWDALVQELIKVQRATLKAGLQSALQIETPHPATTEPMSGVRPVTAGLPASSRSPEQSEK